MKGWTEYSEH